MEQNIKQNSAVLKLCTCWAIEAKVLKLAFSNTMTESVYQELQELLKREYEILIQFGYHISKANVFILLAVFR
ncbi:unnamed protein product [Rhizophagus irregularis]|nr:unnamed protein product [Rhizophagus irregularis]